METMKSVPFNWRLLLFVILFIIILGGAGFRMITIDTDITRFLPTNDRVISDAGYIFRNHPIQDRLVIDVTTEEKDPDLLVETAVRIEEKLRESGLFKQVGTGDMQEILPDLMAHITKNLPILFTEHDLENEIKPLLEPEKIKKKVQASFEKLTGLDGIGQARFIATDPLGLKDLVLKRLSFLAPGQDIDIYRGKLFTRDRSHLLVIANPISPGTDTAFAKQITNLLENIANDLKKDHSNAGPLVTLTPMGAYRVALDNELIVKKDVRKAILITTIGIAALLFLAFHRPILGLFAFLPAVAGTVAAFFVFSLLHSSVSLMALGFGGAVISITVDHGIAFLLFLDRPFETRGKDAAREIRAVGLLAALTTIGAFGALSFCGFPVFEQIGQFTALGIGFSFLFVHTMMPRLFPVMPPATSKRVPLQGLVKRFYSTGKKGLFLYIAFVFVLLFFARPELNVGLDSMNTVTRDTQAAEKLMAEVWGNRLLNKVYLLSEAKTIRDLQNIGDRVLAMADKDQDRGIISDLFVPSLIFPGPERIRGNSIAWKNFWTTERTVALTAALQRAAGDSGFKANAFQGFTETLSPGSFKANQENIPAPYLELFGISKHPEKALWFQTSSLTPGESYDAEAFFSRYMSEGKIFDSSFFSERLGGLLFSSFLKMIVWVGICILALLLLFFLDWKLTLVSLLPVLFALTSTLGTLKLLGHPLDIPGVMLSIVVIGMGIDYSLFLVRSFQRYQPDSTSSELVLMTVFMASSSTIVGFGALCFAEHSLLRSAGLTSLLGIFYSLIGAFLFLPPLLRYIDGHRDKKQSTHQDIGNRITKRYRRMEPYPRMFARFKIKTDPMFRELPKLVSFPGEVKTIVDIGTGYGVPGCWFLEHFPGSSVYGIDPNQERIRVASQVFGNRGAAFQGSAPDLPSFPAPADIATMLDMLHFLNDEQLQHLLKKVHGALREQGVLIIRAIIAPVNRASWLWKIHSLYRKFSGIHNHYRSVEELRENITREGFDLLHVCPSGGNEELVWFIARARISDGIAK
jgi:predicted RND superfamily exporter protein